MHTISFSPFVDEGQVSLAGLTILAVTIYFIKLSILFLYRRLFPTPAFTRVLWAVGGFTTAFTIASVFAIIFECIPVGTQLTTRPHHCINVDANYTALSFINAALDLVLLGLPMPLIWQLHMSQRHKIQLSGIFLLGLL